LAQISKKNAKSQPSISIEDAKGSDMAPIVGDLSQSEKLSEIKPPLKGIKTSQ